MRRRVLPGQGRELVVYGLEGEVEVQGGDVGGEEGFGGGEVGGGCGGEDVEGWGCGSGGGHFWEIGGPLGRCGEGLQ